MGWACFWATSLEEIIGGVIAIISFRPGGRMQQSAVPSVLSFRFRATGDTGSETARIHHAARCGHKPRGHREEVMTSQAAMPRGRLVSRRSFVMTLAAAAAASAAQA